MTELTRGLKWGHSGFPEDSPGAWGARLIAPDDLLGDRQDAVGEVATVVDKINNDGILRGCLSRLCEAHESGWMSRTNHETFVLWMDAELCVIASSQGSGGYVYITAFLFPKEDS